jgi:hypothetical protein
MSPLVLLPKSDRPTQVPPTSEFRDPLDKTPIGDVQWLAKLTGWTSDKIARLARQKVIPGAFQAVPGTRGATWSFRKSRTIAWLESLENK